MRLQIASLALEQLKPRVAEAAEVVSLPQTVSKVDVGHEALKAYAEIVAKERGLDVKRFLYTLGCEGQWKPDAEGDNHTSFGVAQFHNPVTDWGFSIEEAKDPYFAIDHMASAWSKGLKHRWSCYNDAYGTNSP